MDKRTDSVALDWENTGDVKAKITARIGGDPVHADKFDPASASRRGQFIGVLCKKFPGIDPEEVDKELMKIGDEMAVGPAPPGDTGVQDLLSDMPESARKEALAMLRDPQLIQRIVDDIATLGVAGEGKLAAMVYLIGTSRLLNRPLAGIVQGLTSSGKSYVVDVVARLFPEETIVRAHRITPQALVHMPEGELVHRFVVGGERSRRQDDSTAEATQALREMLSDGCLTKLMPVKSGNTIETVKIYQPGPISYVESTTLQEILDEDRNRCIVLNTDERPEQTRRIIEAMSARKATIEDVGCDDVTHKHHAAQRMLHQCRVVIPFAEHLGDLFPCTRTDARRSFGHLLSVIEAITLLYQYQRVSDPGEGVTIEATRADYEVARYLVAEAFARTQSGGVSDAVRRFHGRLLSWANGRTFTTADIGSHEEVINDLQTIRSYVRVLANAGFLELVDPNRGSKPATYKLAADPPGNAELAGLPEVDAVFDRMDNAPRHRVDAQTTTTVGFSTREGVFLVDSASPT